MNALRLALAIGALGVQKVRKTAEAVDKKCGTWAEKVEAKVAEGAVTPVKRTHTAPGGNVMDVPPTGSPAPTA